MKYTCTHNTHFTVELLGHSICLYLIWQSSDQLELQNSRMAAVYIPTCSIPTFLYPYIAALGLSNYNSFHSKMGLHCLVRSPNFLLFVLNNSKHQYTVHLYSPIANYFLSLYKYRKRESLEAPILIIIIILFDTQKFPKSPFKLSPAVFLTCPYQHMSTLSDTVRFFRLTL